jgi:hypothetical protein
MAVVRLTDSLKNAIISTLYQKVWRSREMALPNVEQVVFNTYPTLSERIYEVAVPASVRTLLASGTFPEEYLIQPITYVDVYLNRWAGIPPGMNDAFPSYLSGLRLSMPAGTRMPYEVKTDDLIKQGFSVSFAYYSPTFSDVRQTVMDVQAVHNKYQSDKRAYFEEVDNLLRGFSTLAPALKAWPLLWEYLPETTRDQHKKIVERTSRPKAPAPVEVDTGKLTAGIIAAKMLNANNNNN